MAFDLLDPNLPIASLEYAYSTGSNLALAEKVVNQVSGGDSAKAADIVSQLTIDPEVKAAESVQSGKVINALADLIRSTKPKEESKFPWLWVVVGGFLLLFILKK